ncbi:MAG: FAD-linked oxidase C-terminal domain-containing protein [Gemmatimonadota bacterium]|nr:FAD-linked oxidase C-terminal domain-containing protein [Gemmatimonadota bacterium]
MTASDIQPGDPGLEKKLRHVVKGEVRFDAFTRGIFSTDASHYQVEPLGVVFPATAEDIQVVMEVAREENVPVLPRGAGTSQCGQTVGRAIVVDVSRHLNQIGGVNGDEIEVEPGVVLDHLNARLRQRHQWFPVDPSTGSRATLGGMAGNNSAGARSLRYGTMVDNVSAIEVVLPDGRRLWLGSEESEEHYMPTELAFLRSLYANHAAEIIQRTPNTMRNVAGYNLASLNPNQENLAQLLVGSEGTLAFFVRLRLKLSPLLRSRVLGICHFDGLLEALDTVQHIVKLSPTAVELVDQNILSLGARHPDFRSAMSDFVTGTPKALLLVEFSEELPGTDLGDKLNELEELLSELGHPNSVVRAETESLQSAAWSVRKAGLNILMSMAGPRKPISFIEDCAVPLEHLSSYARHVDEIFSKHGVEGTWYAHASVGCLHVRPALNLRDPSDVRRMRAIAEETHEVVRRYGGTHSGEHGDGLLRSEFIKPMLGERMQQIFGEVKETFDPHGLMNPGKIINPSRMDDPTLFRFQAERVEKKLPVVLDWSQDGGVLTALEQCNNNGACLKSDPGVMCPSYRVTQDERHSTRGRANALRLAVTGQLGATGLDSPEMAEAMSLCISCKGCKRECPTGIDMAALKLEWQYHQNRHSGVPIRTRLLGGLPRIAPWATQIGQLVNILGKLPLGRRLLGFAPARKLPQWHGSPWNDSELPPPPTVTGPADVILFVDTFTRWFEPEVPRAAKNLLEAGSWQTQTLQHPGRPLCCGRTYLSGGMLDEARRELRRVLDALAPAARAGTWIVGLEPSCIYTLRDEAPALLPGEDADVVAERAVLLEEFLDQEWAQGHTLSFKPLKKRRLKVHGHCHQKAFGTVNASVRMLERIPDLTVEEIPSGCCGMAGAFGYQAEHYDVSMAMAELDLLPAVRVTDETTEIVASGTSCRAQIRDGTGRTALHPAVLLQGALTEPGD